jgi:diguanylate cyclase (GGDEF)-like protein/PAS domain S-box-containing protein|tara:strand:- start:39281 stop:41596 length:2316 start_codon:yes stop_codon:yes gene_type:complete
MTDFAERYASLAGVQREMAEKLARLRAMRPFFIDLSLRENAVGASRGQTLDAKITILSRLRQFGFDDILLGTLDYAMPDEPTVDDDFMVYLRDHDVDRRGCFAFTQVGTLDDDGRFLPDHSQYKLRDYAVPNTLHQLALGWRGRQTEQQLDALASRLAASIDWLHDNVAGEGGGAPRIIINVIDGCDGFVADAESMCWLFDWLAGQAIEGVSFEDPRGTFLPFQVGAFVEMARAFTPPPLKLLVHLHAGNGMENAAAIEALLKGADGVWGALSKQAAIIGHASSSELIANLVRLGNPHLGERFRLERLLPLTRALRRELDGEAPVDWPIIGDNAYRLPLSDFRQRNGRFMDLPPESIGGRYRYRLCPQVSDTEVIAGRLAEVTGQSMETFGASHLLEMMRLMRREIRRGSPLLYDDPDTLLALYRRAQASHAEPSVCWDIEDSPPRESGNDELVALLDDDTDIYRALLESTQAIPWRIDWETLRFTYVGPQIAELLGWPADSWESIEDWAERMHPEDRDDVVDYCVMQSRSGIDHEADYRALTQSGEFRWVRDVVHVVRDKQGQVEALVGFMFDIHERKLGEQERLALQRRLETLSFQDGLTEIANRRMFDGQLMREWLSAQKEASQLSLILVDVDHFKQYNDHYGHLAGDDCLRRVATLLGEACSAGLLARYGGEEFVLLLPGCGPEVAQDIAESCRRHVDEAAIEHIASAGLGNITISVGVGSMVPTSDDEVEDFVDAVDSALYRAKQEGRNRVISFLMNRAEVGAVHH